MTDRFRGNWPPVDRGPATRERVDLDDILERLTNGYLAGADVHFSASGSWVKADYPGARAVFVRVQAGGGAGGGATATVLSETSAGSGGGAGGYAEALILVDDLGDSETVTVGAGGTGSSGAAGGDGGTSSFGSHAVAAGGTGGDTLASGTSLVTLLGSDGGAASAGDLQVGGEPGEQCIRLRTNHGRGGRGGSSPLGAGGGRPSGNNSSGSAGAHGSGGAGALNINVQSAIAGAAGGAGRVIVTPLY